MKKLIYILPVLLIIFIIFIYAKPVFKPQIKITQPDPYTSKSTPKVPQSYVPPTESETKYKTNWLIVRDIKKINFYSNLQDKLASNEIINKHLCSYLVSGGYYTKEDNPIGLFIENGEIKNQAINNNLINGYFYINNGKAQISSAPPTSAQIALQAGPLLMKDNQFLPIVGANDNHDRRVLVSILENGNIAFLVMYDKKSPLSGPALSEVANVLETLQKNSSIDVKDVLNLDGGSASAFITDQIKLTELSRIGSYFCINQ